VDDVDHGQLREQDEEHDLQGGVVTQQDCRGHEEKSPHSEQEGAQLLGEGFQPQALIEGTILFLDGNILDPNPVVCCEN
jgi:hypothetical protein